MLLADNLSARITLIMLAGSAALLLIVALLAGRSIEAGGPQTFRVPMPREAQAMASAVEAGGPGARAAIVGALDQGPMHVTLEPGFPPLEAGARAAGPRDRGYGGYARALAGRDFRLEVAPDGRLQLFAPQGDAVRLSVALKDGGVLALQRRAAPRVRALVARSALALAGGVLVVLAMLLLAVRQTARPVAALARAADRFGERLDAEDLPVRGPREIRALASSLNAMRRRIRRLVDERTRMLAAVAHDLRTYLTRLRLRVELIGDEAQRAKAVADLDEMSALIDDTLLFAEEDSGRRDRARTLDLKRELQALVELRREMGEAVDLDAGEIVLVHASPLALRRMVGNLVDNALRFAGAAEIRLVAGDGQASIAVRDRGPGLPEEALERVTGAFERMEGSRNRATGGAGLGLAIVRALAEAQGGRLRLKNRPGGGLAAEIRLPCWTEEEA